MRALSAAARVVAQVQAPVAARVQVMNRAFTFEAPFMVHLMLALPSAALIHVYAVQRSDDAVWMPIFVKSAIAVVDACTTGMLLCISSMLVFAPEISDREPANCALAV